MKERILQEAFKLFGLYGIKGVTMDDIARHLGMSKRTIYENFRDKNQLIEESLAEQLKKSIHEFDLLLDNSENILEGILMHMNKQRESENRCRLRMSLDIQRYYPTIYKKHLETIGNLNNIRLQEVIIKGIEQKVFREDIDPKIVAFLFSEQAGCVFAEQQEKLMLNNTLLQELNIFEVFESLFINFLRGISTLKGIEIIEKFNK